MMKFARFHGLMLHHAYPITFHFNRSIVLLQTTRDFIVSTMIVFRSIFDHSFGHSPAALTVWVLKQVHPFSAMVPVLDIIGTISIMCVSVIGHLFIVYLFISIFFPFGSVGNFHSLGARTLGAFFHIAYDLHSDYVYFKMHPIHFILQCILYRFVHIVCMYNTFSHSKFSINSDISINGTIMNYSGSRQRIMLMIPWHGCKNIHTYTQIRKAMWQ